MTDPRLELGDPTTSAQRLFELAQSNPELGPQIAAHPNAYPGLRDWIAQYAAPAAASEPPQVQQAQQAPEQQVQHQAPAQEWPAAQPAPQVPSQEDHREREDRRHQEADDAGRHRGGVEARVLLHRTRDTRRDADDAHEPSSSMPWNRSASNSLVATRDAASR